MSLKKKKKVKKIIIICVIIAIVLGIFIYHKKKNETPEEKIEMETIEKRTIATSISATGTITTTDTKNITSTLTGMEIKTVNVKEGDTVSVGDVICTFDTSSVAENLALAQSSLNTSQAQANLGVQTARRSLNEAITNKNTQLSNSQNDINNAKNAYDDVQNQLNAVRNTYKEKQAQLNTLGNTFAQEQAKFSNIKAQYDAKQAAYNTAKNAYDTQALVVKNAEIENDAGKLETEKAKLAQLEVAMNTANTELLNYKPTYDSASNAFTPVQNQYQSLGAEVASLQGTIQSLEANAAQLKATYDQLVTAHNQAATAADSTIANMQDSLTNSELGVTAATQAGQGQINAYQEQLEKGVITSTVNGIVTAVGVKVGDIYTGNNIATIEGVQDFIVEAQIDEYDIPDVKVGMQVLIKTDATRDEELKGEITYVASSATTDEMSSMATMTSAAATSTTGKATYKIQIAIQTPNDRLRLGMNAKLSIVTDMKENIWAVPYDCVYTREDGTHYIEIAKNDTGEEKEELTVETGIEGSYYIEIISDAIKEGTKVILPKVDTNNSIESLIEMMGPDAGI